ncbi:MAG: hypothetical protein WC869_01350 [Phycisphaerae bacterium]|jgi:hypothetical protein
MTLKEELIGSYGIWGEHPDHLVADWKYEVANCDTRLGYWDWVVHRMEND